MAARRAGGGGLTLRRPSDRLQPVQSTAKSLSKTCNDIFSVLPIIPSLTISYLPSKAAADSSLTHVLCALLLERLRTLAKAGAPPGSNGERTTPTCSTPDSRFLSCSTDKTTAPTDPLSAASSAATSAATAAAPLPPPPPAIFSSMIFPAWRHDDHYGSALVRSPLPPVAPPAAAAAAGGQQQYHHHHQHRHQLCAPIRVSIWSTCDHNTRVVQHSATGFAARTRTLSFRYLSRSWNCPAKPPVASARGCRNSCAAGVPPGSRARKLSSAAPGGARRTIGSTACHPGDGPVNRSFCFTKLFDNPDTRSSSASS